MLKASTRSWWSSCGSRAAITLIFAKLQNSKDRPEDDLLGMDGMDEGTARLFASKGIRSMEELAECATDELVELTGIDEVRAGELIMIARAPWFAEAQ